jgi:membrane-associated phospholipid phosphatase
MASAREAPAPQALWPIEKLIIANSIIVVCLLGLAARDDVRALLYLAAHIAAAGVLLALKRSITGVWGLLRHWFGLIYLPLCYKEVPYLVSALRLPPADITLANWDSRMWNVDPVFWLSSLQTPPLVELLQIVYSLFIPGVLGLAILLWWYKSRAEFRYGAFMLAATFLLSYLGYLLLPARGPRLMPFAAFHPPLRGLWTFNFLQRLLDSLEGVQYDCFPSGHVAVVLVGCYIARRISARAFYAFSVFASLITFSTVYLRYHYVIDVFAGIALAIVIMLTAPWIYRSLGSQVPEAAEPRPPESA